MTVQTLFPPITRREASARGLLPKFEGDASRKFYAEIDALNVPHPKVRYLGEHHCMDKWEFEISDQVFEFGQGLGFRGVVTRNPHQELVYPVIPHVGEVLLAAFSDSMCANDTFADYCANFGYDEDSRRALAQYLACQESGRKLRKIQVPGLLEVLERWSSEL